MANEYVLVTYFNFTYLSTCTLGISFNSLSFWGNFCKFCRFTVIVGIYIFKRMSKMHRENTKLSCILTESFCNSKISSKAESFSVVHRSLRSSRSFIFFVKLLCYLFFVKIEMQLYHKVQKLPKGSPKSLDSHSQEIILQNVKFVRPVEHCDSEAIFVLTQLIVIYSRSPIRHGRTISTNICHAYKEPLANPWHSAADTQRRNLLL